MQEANIKKTEENKDENADKEIMEEAAEKLASVLITWIEFNRNKDKNAYEKRR